MLAGTLRTVRTAVPLFLASCDHMAQHRKGASKATTYK